jgi:dipeptidase D
MELKPTVVFDCFSAVNKVPRPSKREGKMVAFLKEFATSLNLPYKCDEVGNILISKPATPGYENRRTVVLQSHIDMVCEKNAGVEINFDTDAIQTYVDGEWLRAKGTTLGADNGIGVAMQMAILKSTDVKHGNLECLFTVDEETGLTGAFALQSGFMTGDYLLNLDSEDEGQIFVSCAGGARTEAIFRYTPEAMPKGYFAFRVVVNGLVGGHSGDDINKKRANANKLLVRFLYLLSKKYDWRLCEITAGGLHNAIPREAEAICAVPFADKEAVRVDFNILTAEIEQEYGVTEPEMRWDMESCDVPERVVEAAVARRMVDALQAVHNGVFAICQADDTLVETSSNLASVKMGEPGTIVVTTSQRSSVHSARVNMSNTIAACFELAGATVEVGDGYPGWAMNPDSEILHIAKETYCELFGKNPKVLGIHAGLECGLFSEKYPGLDMISFGPTLRGVHSPEERLYIPSVEPVWKHLLAILERIPEKK